MREKKIQREFIDYWFGFPVRLLNVPMAKYRGIWTPDINYNVLTEAVLRVLSEKPARLTGKEVRFIRLHFGMNLQAFAKRFAVSHVAVMKWEKAGHKQTAMNWATEKDIRLFALSKINSKPTEWVALYENLTEIKTSKSKQIQLDIEKLAA